MKNAIEGYNKNPMGIERESFQIIDAIVEEMNLSYPSENPIHQHIFKRVIHTSADFDYLHQLKIKDCFVENFSKATQSKEKITLYTDTQMVLAGVNKRALAQLGWEIKCAVNLPEVWEEAEAKAITRSMAAVEWAMQSSGKKFFIIGNAPTSIFKLLEYGVDEMGSVLGIVGVPVGFVGAAESKLALYESEMPSITAQGRKGGSNIAASIVNALLYETVGRG